MTCSFVSSPDKGGAVLSAVVDYYLESSSSQAILLLSSIRETHHKVSVLSPSFTLALNPFFFFFLNLSFENTSPSGPLGETERVSEQTVDPIGCPNTAWSSDQEAASMGSSHQPVGLAAISAALSQGRAEELCKYM